jgi:transposase
LADTTAIVTSDRWWAYAHLALARRQLCWAHLRRDFKAHAEGLAAEREFGEHGLALCERVFWTWEVFQHTHDRRELQRTIRSLQQRYKPIIRSYAAKRARNRRCRGMARNLSKAWPALWTFAKHDGVEPTNNHAERALRSAVIYRKLCLGTQSEHGEHRVARLLSAHTTSRLQGRSLFAYLTDATHRPHPRPPSPTAQLNQQPTERLPRGARTLSLDARPGARAGATLQSARRAMRQTPFSEDRKVPRPAALMAVPPSAMRLDVASAPHEAFAS